MISVKWYDGATDTASDPEAMLERLARKQWDSDVDIRVALCKRALYWGDVVIDPCAPALDILNGLVEAGMLKSVNYEPDAA